MAPDHNAFITLLKVQALTSMRSFASNFYSIILPVFLFVVFGLAFGVDANYATFFLPGMIGVMVSSDALFAVGSVIKSYHQKGILREFKNYPIPRSWIFTTFIIVRLIIIIISSIILVITSAILFYYVPSIEILPFYVIGTITCFSIYSFITLSVNFFIERDELNQSVISSYYFTGMFLSDAYFLLSVHNSWIDFVGYAFPLKPVLQFMRGDYSALLLILIWAAAAMGTALFVLSRRRFTRSA